MTDPSNQPSQKTRLDHWLVEAGLCPTRSKAQALVMSGQVLVNDQRVDKAGTIVKPGDAVRLKSGAAQRYVSRGGLKLEGALTTFNLDATGVVALDIGASTGGFTDCLLQHGARHVWAIDVGTNQLDWSLRNHPNVTVMEKTHVNTLTPAMVSQPPATWAVVDVSFISLKKTLPYVWPCLTPGPAKTSTLLTLLKPQFEYRDYCNSSGFDGVVKSRQELETILLGTLSDILALARDHDQALRLDGLAPSPIQGPKGNQEYLVLWQLLHDDQKAETPSTKALQALVSPLL
ncbi:MAG: TlyA family RNA methyltransferase [Cyanobacteria bacterium HKST-UBA06]|nr:TlyA family RNA methyltransferase [Cyanobacteria bacterium HKST-UBA04]MCA9806863.1 TlyA family RNA methyltransferase [Cyanobacteria bacterium HKST-UBA06]